MEHVILVDESDKSIGTEEKIKAHKNGLLHRAFSIFVFNPSGELLLQKRNPEKYHCGNLWSNTCCSHPRPEELLRMAIHRRLIEEMGFDCELFHMGSFIYRSRLSNGFTEYEVDHMYQGTHGGKITVNEKEVSDYRWIDLRTLHEDLTINQNNYTPWLKPALKAFFNTSRMPFSFLERS
jgi:isopentenyl-diphosphate delta-isomerase